MRKINISFTEHGIAAELKQVMTDRQPIKIGNLEFFGVHFSAGHHGGFMEAAEVVHLPWSGEGLPPVGIECEVMHCEEWTKCQVIAHFDQRCGPVAAYTVDIGHGVKQLDACVADQFRPLRTPEQIAAEEIRDIADWLHTNLEELDGVAKTLHASGYRRPEE